MIALPLTSRAFEASRRFIETTARPLDIARFHHAFDGGPAGAVLHALKEYQNTDGGFGHALEPDLRAKESSALCTTIAFQILREINAKPDEELVKRGMQYFIQTLDQDTDHWRIIPETAERSPHAPWWNQKNCVGVFEAFSPNPTAEILGYLIDYQEHVPDDLFSNVYDSVAEYIACQEKMEMHALLCCLRLFETRNLPQEMSDIVQQKLSELIPNQVATNSALWKDYSLRPLQVVESPESPFMTGLEVPVAANLNYEILTRNKDGSWSAPWSWGDVYPEEWKLASREWAGVLTLEKLLTLKRFGRIEGVK